MSIGLVIIIVLLAIVAAALLVGEVFLVPGVGFAGLLGVGTVAGAEYYLIRGGYDTMAVIFALLTIVFFCIAAYFMSRRKVVRKVALSSEISSSARQPVDVSVGATGIARSRLALKGTVEVEGKIFEATSEQGFIDEDMPIYVSRIDKDTIYVSLNKRGTAKPSAE